MTESSVTTSAAASFRERRIVQLFGGLMPPLVAFGLQWALWELIQPLVWFLFYPAVFISSWIEKAVVVQSQPSAGSTFTLVLPRLPKEQAVVVPLGTEEAKQ